MCSFMFEASGSAGVKELAVGIDVSTADDVGATYPLVYMWDKSFVHFPLFGRSHPTRTPWHVRLPGFFCGVVGNDCFLLVEWFAIFF